MKYGLVRSKGFTLIEISVIMLIIVLLVAIAYPNYSSIITEGKRRKAMNDLRVIGDAAIRYYAANGNWPDKVSELIPAYIGKQIGGTELIDPWGRSYSILVLSKTAERPLNSGKNVTVRECYTGSISRQMSASSDGIFSSTSEVNWLKIGSE